MLVITEVNKLLSRFGEVWTLTTPGTSTYDPATSTVTETGGTSEDVKVFFFEYDQQDVDGTNIQREDRGVRVGTKDTLGNTIAKPSKDSTLTNGTDVLNVVKVQEIRLKGKPVHYTCQVRE